MTGIEAVRLRSSDKSVLTSETDTYNGDTAVWKLGHGNISGLTVRRNGALLTEGSDYTVDAVNGLVTIALSLAVGDKLIFEYYWSIFSDVEVQYFVDESGGDITVATAKLLLAIAADASKVAQRQSMAGGGGLGAVTLDTSVTARELRNTAKALLEMERDVSQTIPADGLTEPHWTEFNSRDSVEQHLIRES
jgi:hypothetical protein